MLVTIVMYKTNGRRKLFEKNVSNRVLLLKGSSRIFLGFLFLWKKNTPTVRMKMSRAFMKGRNGERIFHFVYSNVRKKGSKKSEKTRAVLISSRRENFLFKKYCSRNARLMPGRKKIKESSAVDRMILPITEVSSGRKKTAEKRKRKTMFVLISQGII